MKGTVVGIFLILAVPFLGIGQVINDDFYLGISASQPPQLVIDKNDAHYFAYVNFDSVPGKLILNKTTLCGDLLWSRRIHFNQTINRLVGLRYDGENLILAAVAGGAFPDSSLIVAKIDRLGQNIWSRQFTKTGADFYWYNMDVNSAGEVFLNANVNQGSTYRSVITKLDQNGSIIWSSGYITNAIWGMGAGTNDGGFLRAVGTSLYKLNAQGQMLWFKRLNNSLYQSQMPPLEVDGGYLIFTNGLSASSCQIAKIDKGGNKLWESKVITGFNIRSAGLLDSGRFVIGGDGYNSQFSSELRFVVFNSQGEILAQRKRVAHNNNRFFNALAYQNGLLRSLNNILINNEPGMALFSLPVSEWQTGACATESASFSTQNSTITSSSIATVNGQGFNFQISSPAFSLIDLQINHEPQCSQLVVEKLPDLGADTSLCENQELTLRAKPELAGNYIWNTGESGSEITITEGGRYYFNFTPACSDTSFSDTIVVTVLPAPTFELNYNVEQRYQPGDVVPVSTNSPSALSFIWLLPNGENKTGPSIDYTIQNAGTDSLQVTCTDTNACTSTQTLYFETGIPELIMPTAFTPNGDGLNDSFGPPSGAIYNFRLRIQDRFGKRVADLKNENWDGTNSGKKMPQGTYVYLLEYRFYADDSPRFYNGHLNLIR